MTEPTVPPPAYGWLPSEAWHQPAWYAPPAPRPRRRWPWALSGFVAGAVTVPAVFLGVTAVTDSAQTSSVDAQVRAELPGLEAFVERTRGLSFVHPVQVEVLGDDDFLDAYDDGQGTDGTDVPTAGDATAQALGEGADLSYRAADALDQGVVGFYDDQDGRLVVRGDVLDATTRQTVVHELTHALQDQHFDLSAADDRITDPEQRLAWDALVEGDATRVEQAWYDAQPGAVQDEIDVSGGPLTPDQDVAADLTGFPYYAGPGLVRGLLNSGGQAALDAAFAAPPVTTAQVLHPGAAAPVEVAAPTGLPQGHVLDTGVLGELGLAHLLGRDATRRGPQAGWAGDHYTTVEEPLGPCTYDDVVTRTPADQRSLLVALQGWVEARDDAAVTATGPTSLRLRSCWDS